MSEAGLLPARGVELIHAVNSLNAQFGDQRRGRDVVNADSLRSRLSARDGPEPDIALARTTRSYGRERPCPDEVALIVEMADSSLTFDLGEKRRKYAAAGISEYWGVDLNANVVHVFRNPVGSFYAESHVAILGSDLSPFEYPDVAIDVSLVFGEVTA